MPVVTHVHEGGAEGFTCERLNSFDDFRALLGGRHAPPMSSSRYAAVPHMLHDFQVPDGMVSAIFFVPARRDAARLKVHNLELLLVKVCMRMGFAPHRCVSADDPNALFAAGVPWLNDLMNENN